MRLMPKPPPEVYGIPVKEIAAVCRVSEKTAARWKDGTTCPPSTALMILSRDLGCFASEWAGWTIRGGELISPEGWTVNRNDALTVPLMHGQISTLRAELRRLQEEREALEDQPSPEEWQVEIA